MNVVIPPNPGMRHTLHFRPVGARCGDPIPFYWNGLYHVFYLRIGQRSRIPWGHIVSQDLIHWEEWEDALTPAPPDQPDGEHVFTGCVVAHEGTFHIWYTGHNTQLPVSSVLMHATSRDLRSWTKQPADTCPPDGLAYRGDFRDPHIWWDAARGNWAMVLAARGGRHRQPAVGTMESPDLCRWKPAGALNLQTDRVPECPDLFAISGRWYLLASPMQRGTEWSSTSGDWRSGRWEPFRVLDTPFLYAAKRMWDGRRHIVVGWIGDLAGERDGGGRTWGGTQCLPRELYADEQGDLCLRPIPEAEAFFTRLLLAASQTPPRSSTGGTWLRDGVLVGRPEHYQTTAVWDAPSDFWLHAVLELRSAEAVTLEVRRQAHSEESYRLILNRQEGTITAAGPGLDICRLYRFAPDQVATVKALVRGTIIEWFVDDRAVLSVPVYNLRCGQVAVVVEGQIGCEAAIRELLLSTSDEPGAMASTTLNPVVEPSQQPMSPFFAVPGKSLGDPFPFYWEGTWHLFFMQSRGIAHWSSSDLVHWRRHAMATLPGKPPSGDSGGNATGAIVEHEGLFHLFYTGNQNVCHATSTDLEHWSKSPDNPVLTADGSGFDPQNFRDPGVFWNAREGCWWMLLGTQRLDTVRTAAACVAISKSTDLRTWSKPELFWFPGTHTFVDCPHLIEHNGQWYLLVLPVPTRYRVATDPAGPWVRPPVRDLASPMLSAGNRPAGDGRRFIAWGFVPRTTGREDTGRFVYGGVYGAPRELVFGAPGVLHERLAPEMAQALENLSGLQTPWAQTGILSGQWEIDSQSARCLSDDGGMIRFTHMPPRDIYLSCEVQLERHDSDLLLYLRCDVEFGRGYQLELQPRAGLLTLRRADEFDLGPVLALRPVEVPVGRPFTLRVILAGEILEAFVDERTSLTHRVKEFRSGSAGFMFRDGPGEVRKLKIARIPWHSEVLR